MKVGCLGPEGTFSQQALKHFAKEKPHEEILFGSITEVILAANRGEIDFAVVPLENSLEGAVNTTLDALATDVDLKIHSEMLLSIHQNLLSNVPLDKITHIFSHPQPVGQCSKYIEQNLSNVPVEFTQSTAIAARKAAKTSGGATLGSSDLANLYDLDILDENIEDNSANITRFIVLGKEEAKRSEKDKTLILFATKNTPGSLYKVLSVFYIFDINMIRIESRPAKTVLGEYIFFVEIEGNVEDENIKKALDLVKYKTSFFKCLGSFKDEIN